MMSSLIRVGFVSQSDSLPHDVPIPAKCNPSSAHASAQRAVRMQRMLQFTCKQLCREINSHLQQ